MNQNEDMDRLQTRCDMAEAALCELRQEIAQLQAAAKMDLDNFTTWRHMMDKKIKGLERLIANHARICRGWIDEDPEWEAIIDEVRVDRQKELGVDNKVWRTAE